MNNLNNFDIKSFSKSIYYKEKNRTIFKKIAFIILLIFFSLFISLIIIQMIGYNMFDAIEALFTRPFQNYLYKDFITNICILGLSALAFTISYKSGLFNIGVSGQMMAAGLAIVSLSKNLTFEIETGSFVTSTGPSGVILTIIVAMLTGIFVSLIAGALKVYFKVHEVVSTILINWIIFFLGKWLITTGPLNNPNDSLNSAFIHGDLAFYNENLLSGFVGALCAFLLVAIILWVLLKYTVFGKQLISIGKSKNASHYAGYRLKTLQLSSFAMTGAISGLLACVVYTSNATRAMPVPLINAIPVEGFNGIAISLIAFANPLAIIPVSFIMSMFTTASLAAAPFPNSMGLLIIGLVMYGTSIISLLYQLDFLNRIRNYLTKKYPKEFVKKWNEKHEIKMKKIKDYSKSKYSIQNLNSNIEVESNKDNSKINLKKTKNKKGGK